MLCFFFLPFLSDYSNSKTTHNSRKYYLPAPTTAPTSSGSPSNAVSTEVSKLQLFRGLQLLHIFQWSIFHYKLPPVLRAKSAEPLHRQHNRSPIYTPAYGNTTIAHAAPSILTCFSMFFDNERHLKSCVYLRGVLLPFVIGTSSNSQETSELIASLANHFSFSKRLWEFSMRTGFEVIFWPMKFGVILEIFIGNSCAPDIQINSCFFNQCCFNQCKHECLTIIHMFTYLRNQKCVRTAQ